MKKIPKARELLIAEGRKVFLGSGYAALDIKATTASCGMATGTFYNYFPGKKEFALAIIADDCIARRERANDIVAQALPMEEEILQIAQVLRGYRTEIDGRFREIPLEPAEAKMLRDKEDERMNLLACRVMDRHLAADPTISDKARACIISFVKQYFWSETTVGCMRFEDFLTCLNALIAAGAGTRSAARDEGSLKALEGYPLGSTPSAFAAEKERATLTATLERERLLSEYVQTLNGVEPYDTRIETVLANLGAQFQADRTYIFRLDDGKTTNLFEWCREGVTRGKGSFQNVDDAFAQGWYPAFKEGKSVIVSDVERIRTTYPEEYRVMSAWGVTSYLEAPLVVDGELAGFVGAENPAPEKIDHSGDLLLSLAYALSNTIVREQYERKLRESQHRFELAIEGAELGVWEYDCATHTISSPSNSFAKFGITGAIENVPESIMPMFDEHEQYHLADFYRRVDQGDETKLTGDFWMRWQPGMPERCERVVYTVVRDENGKAETAYGIGMNYTAQARETRSYRQSLQTLLAANPEALCTFQLNLTKNRCGEGYGTASYILDALRATSVDDLFANITRMAAGAGDRKAIRAILSRKNLLAAFETGTESAHVDYRRSDEDGEPFWARTYISMLRNPDTLDVEGVVYSQDITKARQTEEILRIITSREYDLIALLHLDTGQFEAMFLGEGLPSFYHRFLPEPGAVCSFADLSRAAEAEWLSGDDRDRYHAFASADYIRDRVRECGNYEVTVTAHFADSSHKGEMLRRLQHYRFDQDIVLVVESDVTETHRQKQRELERERKLRAQADAANEAKSEFLSSVSHDMRTPLNAMLGYAAIAESAKDGGEVRDYLGKIEQSGRVLKQLIEDVLDLNKISTGEVVLSPMPIAMNHALDDLVAAVAPSAQQKKVSFTVEEAGYPNDRVMVDVARVRQVVLNLLTNAIKFTDEGGTVTLSLRRVSAQGGRAHDEITVTDTGCGMSPAFLGKVFEPFSQERTQRNASIGGSGLGLSVAKRLVELMGGSIEVESKLDVGSTFTVRLDYPFAALEKDDAAQNPRSSRLTGKRILVVEDNDMNAEIIMMLLRRVGAETVRAADGREGVAAFVASPLQGFDAILMDVRMPVMDGLEATRAIRALDRADAQTVPIIASTANTYEGDIRDCLAAGMDAHTIKPINPQILLQTIKEAMDAERGA